MEKTRRFAKISPAKHRKSGDTVNVDQDRKNEVALLYNLDNQNDCDVRRTRIKEGMKLVIDSYLQDRQKRNYHSDLDFFSEVVRNIESLRDFGFTVHYSPVMASCRMNGINYNVTKSSVMVKDRGKNLFFMYRKDSDKLYNVVFDELQMMSDERRNFHIEMSQVTS